MPSDATFAAACITSVFATPIMGFYANDPIAVAPGMGLNAFFTYAVVAGMKLPWQTALGAVFISGVIFFLLTVTKVREWIVDGVPQVLRLAIGVGIGLFIAFIGLRNAGIVTKSDATLVTLGNMRCPGVLQMKDDILEYLEEHDIWYSKGTDPAKVAPEVDVVY